MSPFKLALTNTPAPDDVRTVESGLESFNALHAPGDQYEPLCVFLHDDADRLAGGLLGNTYWGWLSINIVWLREDTRGFGYGRRMIALAEAEALRRGCHYAHVDTIDFQALEFYLKLGYAIWGQLENLPPGHTRYYLKKTLSAGVPAAHGVD